MMSKKSVVILGGGNTAFSVAALLTLRGFEITLYEIPAFEASLTPIREEGGVHLQGVAGQGKQCSTGSPRILRRRWGRRT